MNIVLNIQHKLSDQFIEYFDMKIINGVYTMNPKMGNGTFNMIEFPSKLELYHFKKYYYRIPVHMKSVNPTNTDWYLFHINISNVKQTKFIEGQTIELQKHAPVGVIIYGPGIEIDTDFEPNQDVEVVSFRMHKHFLQFYFDDEIRIEDKMSYEVLDYQLEELLNLVLSNMHSKILCHRYVLEFFDLLFKKLQRRNTTEKKINLHAEDIKSLFLASSYLRNPSAKELPVIQELASIANMSQSKFKSSFKQLFGTSPKQFHHKIRMEYAKSELQSKRKTPTELSFEFGYTHPSNFTSAFKKYFNELPSAYK